MACSMQPKSPTLAVNPAAIMLVHSAAAAYIMPASAAQHRKPHSTTIHLLTICCLHAHTCNADRAGSSQQLLAAQNLPIFGTKPCPASFTVWPAVWPGCELAFTVMELMGCKPFSRPGCVHQGQPQHSDAFCHAPAMPRCF
jgi:hypothetical protein